MRKGITTLPLHYGKAPRWLFERMKLLAREIISILVREEGERKFLENFSHPGWFQSFGCVLGFDWHSSGLTTTVCGAVKEALGDIGGEVGVFLAGGKGGTSRKTPQEIEVNRYRFDHRTIYRNSLAPRHGPIRSNFSQRYFLSQWCRYFRS